MGDDESRLSQILSDKLFREDWQGVDQGEIQVDNLLAFAILHCAGNAKEKSEVLYTILQEGGFEKHKSLSAQDNEVTAVFSKLMRLCTIELANLISEVDDIVPDDVKPLANKATQIDAINEYFIEEHYVTPLFGNVSRLTYRKWLDLSSTTKQVH